MDDGARIYLEDGTVVDGVGFGAQSTAVGEVVFTTAMNGYPESLTDPSYKGQILVITHPLVGNYGVPKRNVKEGILGNFESEKIAISGLVVGEVTYGTKWNSVKSIDKWMSMEGIPGICNVDTRALTKKIRDSGAMMGVIAKARSNANVDALLKNKYGSIELIRSVSPKKPIFHNNPMSNKNVVIVDFGVKHGILQSLYELGYNLIRVPFEYSADKIMSFEPDGILYSNGPGDPNLLEKEAENFNDVLEHGIPMMGLCLGHQIAIKALGGRVEKMKFGHRAINKPVMDLETKKAYITTHNHGYAAYRKNLPQDLKEWFVSLDDGVVEGTKSLRHKLITTQFHPEARPGTKDAHYVFGVFDKMINDANK